MTNFIKRPPHYSDEFSDKQMLMIEEQCSIVGNSKDYDYFIEYIEDPKTWKFPRVSFDTFLDDPRYLGIGAFVYPEVRRLGREIIEGDYSEAIIVAGIGGGKTLLSNLLTCYMAHTLLCYRNPHRYFKLIKDKPITLMNMGTTATQALEVGFAGIKTFIQGSPWFQRFYPHMLSGSIRFLESNILILSGNSKATTPLGFNIFNATLDEAAFYLDNDKVQLAEEIYMALQRRILSRFQNRGLLVMITSPLYDGDFSMRKLEEARAIPHIIYSQQMPTWKLKPMDKKKNIFYFNSRKGTIIEQLPKKYSINKVEDAFDSSKEIWEIPVEYKTSFVQDPDKAKRDFAAVPSKAIQAFMPHWEIIRKMFTDQESPILSDEEYVFAESPLRSNYYIHIDLALNKEGKGDFAGIAMCHFAGWEVNPITKEKHKTVIVDLAERIGAGATGEVNFEDVRNKVYTLKKMGFTIKKVTLDSFQSNDTRQLLKSKGINSDYLSVDRTIEPYQTLKEMVYSGRIKCHKMPVLEEELRRLEITKANKVDHAPGSCFTGDTRIALLDGTHPTLKELSEKYSKGEVFEVYSVGKNGVCVGFARNPRITKKAAELVEIILDNNQVIRCTLDHLFMTYDGEWIKAENLTSEVCLMPLYKTVQRNKGWFGYERLTCVKKKDRVLTHRLVAEQIYGDIPEGYIIHHKDGNKLNNSSCNLEILDRKLHVKYHTTKRHKEDEEYVKKLRKGHKTYRENGGNEKSRKNILNLFKLGKLKRGRDICSIEGCINLSSAKGMCDVHYQRMRRIKLKTNALRNHRILSIKKLNYTEDVYDITVKEHHNFALSSGIFVHNSKDVADAVCGAVFSCVQQTGGEVGVLAGDFYTKKQVADISTDKSLKEKQYELLQELLDKGFI